MSNDKIYFVTPDGCLVEIPSVLVDSVGVELVGFTPKEAYTLRYNQLVNERKRLFESTKQTEKCIDLIKVELINLQEK